MLLLIFFAMELKFVNVIGFRSEDSKYSARNLMQGGKWLSEKNSRSSVNDVTLSLNRAAVINAIDIGNCGSSFVSVDVTRTGLHNYESLLPSTEVMSGRDAVTKNKWTCVHMFCEDHFTPGVQEQKWDMIRVTCMQPFLNNVQFGLSFIKVFSFPEKEPSLPRSPTPPQPGSSFAKMRERLVGKVPPVTPASRSEQLLLAAKEINSSVKKIGKDKFKVTNRKLDSGTNKLTIKKDCSQTEDVQTSSKSSCQDDNCGEDIINLVSESDSDTATVLLPLMSPCKRSRVHSSESTLSPYRIQRDFDSLSEAETVILDEKVEKSMKPSKTKTVELLSRQETGSICDEPQDIIVLNYDEVPCPLCSELFDISEIEQHAATCNLNLEPTLECPVCLKYFPPEILSQHAQLCVEIRLKDK